eukprot:873214_1
MSSSVCFLVLLIFALQVVLGNNSPTISNSTGLFWIAPQQDSPNSYQSGTIICNAPYCHIVCKYSLSCHFLKVNATSSLTTLVIDCHPGACQSAHFDGSNIGNSFNITCNGQRSCYGTTIYCPTDVPCNIHCLVSEFEGESSGSCDRTQFVIAHKWTHTLKLESVCPDTSSFTCQSAYVRCNDTNRFTLLKYRDSVWKCEDYNCCPFFEPVTCSMGVPCQIDCDTQRCSNAHIIATEATSLTLDCGLNSCQGAQIDCPTGANTSCNILCPSDHSCEYTSVQGTNTIDQLSVHCDGSYACQYMQLQLDSAKISQLDLNCSASYSCLGLNTASMSPIIDYLNIDCTNNQACDSATISATITSTPRVNCVNPSISTFGDSGACHSAEFHMYVSINNENQRSNMSYVCGAYDCYDSVLNVSGFYSIDMPCNTPYACSMATVYASQSDQLSVECSGEKGCFGTAFLPFWI